MIERLADTEEIRKIESRFANLISRTFLKGAVGKPGPQIQDSVKKAFSSKTYEVQLDKIIDDIYIASAAYADSKTEELGISSPSSSGSAQASRTAGKDKPLPITAEAIKQTKALSGDAAESVTRWLKDNDLYTQHPDQLARQVKDLWGGERYKARRFAVTFTADLAENTAVHRYNDLGITYLQFYAEIDEKTTPQCRQFHGTIIKSNSLDAQKYRPPLHHHCLIKGTRIQTIEGEKNIEDLKIEDLVLTHKGRYQPVIDTMNRPADDILEISTGKRTIKITSNHPVFTKRNNQFIWVLAGDLREGDEIAII